MSAVNSYTIPASIYYIHQKTQDAPCSKSELFWESNITRKRKHCKIFFRCCQWSENQALIVENRKASLHFSPKLIWSQRQIHFLDLQTNQQGQHTFLDQTFLAKSNKFSWYNKKDSLLSSKRLVKSYNIFKYLFIWLTLTIFSIYVS